MGPKTACANSDLDRAAFLQLDRPRTEAQRRLRYASSRDLSEPHMSIATHRLSSELNREGDLCQTTSKVAWATAKYSSRRCQSYALGRRTAESSQDSLSKKR